MSDRKGMDFTTLSLAGVYGLVALGVYLTFRIANSADLTVDASFTAGGAALILLAPTWGIEIALLAGLLAGALLGAISAFLARVLAVDLLLASILVLYASYSIFLRILSAPNAVLLAPWSLTGISASLLLIGLVIAITVLLGIWYHAPYGLSVRAAATHKNLLTLQGADPVYYITFTVILSNALVGLAGAFFVLTMGFFDIAMGQGTLVAGLCAITLGEMLIAKTAWFMFACLIGSGIFRTVIAFALEADWLGLQASDIQLIASLAVILLMLQRRFHAQLLCAFDRIRQKI